MKTWKVFDNLIKQKNIDLNGQALKDDDLDILVEVLQKSNVLEELNLYCNYITLADDKFTNALAKNHTLKILGLGGNNIGAEGAKHLAGALKVNVSLEEVCLGGNRVGVEGARSLAGALAVNVSLQEVFLSHNKIGAEGAKELANALKSNHSIEYIYLGQNHIGDKGANSFANTLLVNRSLQVLSLNENKIGNGGAQSMATSLLINQTLRELWLNVNQIGNEGAQTIADVLEYNHNIKRIELWRNNVGSDMEERIVAILKKPERRNPTLLQAPLNQLESFIANKDNEIEALKAKLENSQPIIDTVDLTSDESEPANKRPHKENAARSSLAIQHESNQKVVQIKQEKCAAETQLKDVQKEKQSMEANLEEVREDLDDANELVGQQSLATNIWQGRFDELASLVEAGQVDGAAISAIRNRSLASGS